MSKKDKFKGQVVLITGASSGIGRATALEFAKQGAKLALVSRSQEKLNAVADEIRSINQDVLVVPTDVSSTEQVAEMVQKVLEAYGRVDVLFNNAGSSYVARVEDENFLDDLKKMIDVDFYGTIYATKEVLPVMKKQGSGHIMNMSSVVGRKAFPHFGGYSSAMHAISAFTDSLRQELSGTGINISIIHPALTQTPLLDHVNPEDMPPPFRAMTPITVESVAKAVVNGVQYNQARIIVPYQPRILIALDAISPRIGDLIVRGLSNKIFARVLGTYRGKLYHEYKY